MTVLGGHAPPRLAFRWTLRCCAGTRANGETLLNPSFEQKTRRNRSAGVASRKGIVMVEMEGDQVTTDRLRGLIWGVAACQPVVERLKELRGLARCAQEDYPRGSPARDRRLFREHITEQIHEYQLQDKGERYDREHELYQQNGH